MFERLRGKNINPSFDELIAYCGDSGALWIELESFLFDNYDLKKIIHDSELEGWGVNYKHDKKHICDIHAEANAFVVIFQIRSEEIEKLRDNLSENAMVVWSNRYPCGHGGWMRYRVTKREQLYDIQKLLTAKVKPKKKIEF